jgi:hypothetical protein
MACERVRETASVCDTTRRSKTGVYTRCLCMGCLCMCMCSYVACLRRACVDSVYGVSELCAAVAAAASRTLVVALDHRNHGHRLQNTMHNMGWSNPTHLIDMFSIQWGTAADIWYTRLCICLCLCGCRCEHAHVYVWRGAWRPSDTGTHTCLSACVCTRVGVGVCACVRSNLADTLPCVLPAPVRGFGVAGVSLGGHTTLLVLANGTPWPMFACHL